MDLDLFGGFDSAVTEADLAEIVANNSSATEIEHDRSAKRPRIESKNDDNSATNEETVVIIQNKSGEETEKGDKVTTITALPSNYSSAVVMGSNPNNVAEEASKPKGPAKEYNFKLDTFQQEAVNYIEKGESVLVAAHTSAGKTATAEYAIAKSLRDGQRVIYTSPIKALSNQKYRDLQEEFTDVGLMTGDMTINPNATCLIMTTEILRSMLYRGSEVVREVAWVIFDEVHYMRDKERGIVWEESIILLPHKVRFLFLSATIPNAKEFVGWIAKIHHQPCHVVYTDYRPTPLQHFVFPMGAEGLYLVVDEKSRFREDNFQKAMAMLQLPDTSGGSVDAGGSGSKRKKTSSKGGNTDLFKIVRLIMERNLDPCIVFSFSKKDCETYALQMARLDFNNAEEKQLVEQVFSNALEALSEDDQQLPQVQTLLPLLKNGVGIHHGGLLPILKEIIEILFQEGLIKCLFATETFSIGINMPAKTVVFTTTRKFDGKDFRWLTSGEYIQMSGRAGRRGKDDKGIVIQMLDEKMEPDVAKDMVYGDPDALYSSYRVSYNMVLNMLRVEDADPENLLKSSFHQYQQEQLAPAMETQANELQREANAIQLLSVTDNAVSSSSAILSTDAAEINREHAITSIVAEHFSYAKLLDTVTSEICHLVRAPELCLPFLQPGRLLYVKVDDVNWGWGVVVNVLKAKSNMNGFTASNCVGFDPKSSDSDPKKLNIIDMLLEVVKNEGDELSYSPAGDKKTNKSEIVVFHVSLEAITKFSQIRLTLPTDIRKDNTRKGVLRAINEIKTRFDDGSSIPLLNPITDMGMSDENYSILIHREAELKDKMKNHTAFHNLLRSANNSRGKDETELTVADVMNKYSVKMELLETAKSIRASARESQSVTMRAELKKMMRVLRRVGYISANGVLETKGRFACELNTGDELVLTDMIFEGIFNELSVEQCVALLSCFVHKEGGKSKDGKEGIASVRTDLQPAFRQLQSIARNVAKVSIDAKMTMEEEEYVESFNPGLMEVTYEWCAGAKFIEICRLTAIFEGSIIRTIRRLEELLRQLGSAALAIGNQELRVKFEDGASKIRRGVIFAASLYL